MNNLQPKYSLLIYSLSGKPIIDLSGYMKRISLSQKRNRADSLTVDFDLEAVGKYCNSQHLDLYRDVFITNYNEARLLREGKVITAGQITYKTARSGRDSHTLSVRVSGWLDLLSQRRTSDKYTQIDAGAIAWDLIEKTQARTYGYFGLQKGTIQSSFLRDRSYELTSISEAIIALSEVINGFDFEITWDKVFNVYYPKIGAERPDVVFTYPGNVLEVGYEEEGLKIANHIIARGSGTGTGAFIATADDTEAQKVNLLREDVLDYSDISDSQTLQEHAEEDLKNYSGNINFIEFSTDGSLSPVFGSYGLGDIVRFQSFSPYYSFLSDKYRLDAIDLDVDENESENIRIRSVK